MLILLQALLFTGAACGIAYCSLALWATIKFGSRSRRPSNPDFVPPVSVLKPLCGLDPHGYESLRTHCIQDYPEYEIVFGVSAPNDPAVPAVEQLIREFPGIPIRLVVCPNVFGMNLKVSNLLQMLPEAGHQYIVINDSDIAVPPDYLRQVTAPLEDPSVGITTCLFRGISAGGIGSRLESMAIECDFIPGVLCAGQLEKGIHFAMGSTMAFHREVLQRIGGLQTIADYLADDYELGYRVSNAGLRIELADCVVDHHLPQYSWIDFLQHQLRWARTVRSCRPGGYAGMIMTFAFLWSFLAVSAAPSLAGLLFVFTSLALRISMMAASRRFVLARRPVLRYVWLLPVHDFVAPVIWLLAYMGTRIVWRGNKFELANGKLRPA
jgi:ceramide glucosyltransferase